MNHQIYQEASDWLVEFRTEEIDAPMRQRFQSWLESSPAHVQAYLELARIWEVVGTNEPADTADVDSLIARAQATGNVFALAKNASAKSIAAGAPANAARRLATRRFAIAAALVAVTLTAGWLYSKRNTYSTDVGEQRSILLSDGSTIDLNARSTVRVNFTDGRRDIELLEGQALFQVAKDKGRPFIVQSNQTIVRAVGTQFDVNRKKRSTVVTVVEGAVSVSASDSYAGDTARVRDERAPLRFAAAPVLLTAGEQAVLTPGNTLKPRHADVVTATAWKQRRLVFDSTPLEEVAEEFNRNNARPLAIEGAGLDDFHVSGAFSSSDPQPLLRFLRAQEGIEVREQSDRIVVSSKR